MDNQGGAGQIGHGDQGGRGGRLLPEGPGSAPSGGGNLSIGYAGLGSGTRTTPRAGAVFFAHQVHEDTAAYAPRPALEAADVGAPSPATSPASALPQMPRVGFSTTPRVTSLAASPSRDDLAKEVEKKPFPSEIAPSPKGPAAAARKAQRAVQIFDVPTPPQNTRYALQATDPDELPPPATTPTLPCTPRGDSSTPPRAALSEPSPTPTLDKLFASDVFLVPPAYATAAGLREWLDARAAADLAPAPEKEPEQSARPRTVMTGDNASNSPHLHSDDMGGGGYSMAVARRLGVLLAHIRPSSDLIEPGFYASHHCKGAVGGGGGGSGHTICKICYKPQNNNVPPGTSSQWCSCKWGIPSAGQSLGEHSEVTLQKALAEVEDAWHELNMQREKEGSLRQKLQMYQNMLTQPGLEKKTRYRLLKQAAETKDALKDCLASVSKAMEALAEAQVRLQRAQLRAGN